MRNRLRSKATLLFLAFAVAIFAVAGTAMALTTDGSGTTALSPTVQSDKADYAPGDTVTLTGSNWQPGEVVHINVNDDQGKTWSRDVDVTADQNGGITDQFQLPDWFVATYKVTATGAQSGVATTTFTDGQLRAAAANLSSSQQWTVTSIRYSGNNCDGSVIGPVAGNSQSLTGAAQTGNLAGGGTNSVKLTASNPSAAGGKAFDKWTWTNTNSPAGTVTGSDTNATTCVDAGKLASNDLVYTANYVNSVNTTTTAPSKSATYGDSSVQLNANVAQASGPAVNSGTVTFTVKKGATTIGTVTSGTVSGGSASANFPLSGVNADTYTIEAAYNVGTGFNASNNSAQTPAPTLTVNKKTVTGSFTADNKAYDGGTSATILTRSLTGKVGTDDVSLSGGTATFGDKNVGTGKTVTGTGFTLSGAKANNYTLASSTLTTTADITAKSITGSFTAADKEYDGNDSATVTGRSLSGLGSDDVSLTGGTATFADKNVGTGKTVTLTGASLTGADAGNYTLGSVGDATADIMAKSITGSFTAADKEYDGNASATVTDRSLTGAIAADTVSLTGGTATFADKNAGTGKTVTVNGISVTGTDSGNYTHNASATTTANIAPRPINVTADAKSKLFGDPDPALTYQVSGGPLVGTDSFTGALSRDPGEAVAQYNILLGSVKVSDGNNGNNYAINYTSAKLTIGAWTLKGFYQPVDVGIINNAKAGSTVPLKFEVFKGATELTNVSDVKQSFTQKINCASGTGDDIETYSSGNTSLRYDATGGQFIFNWQTPKAAGSCYRVTLTTLDGSQIYADFRLR